MSLRGCVYKSAQYALLLIIPLTFAVNACAEVVLDGTLGTKGSVTGPNFNITSTMGQIYGGNLFHSFSAFNLATGENATFSNSSTATITNIISRVTGGQASSIDGTIKSTIAGADFWFINPSGIVFGQNAKLDVGGSFHASTADYIRLGDDNRFEASNPATPILTSASPAAFGFLSSNPQSISINGSFLKVPEGKTLSLVGGNLDIQNSNLFASAGTINLISVVSAGEAVVDKQNFNVDSFGKFGEINIKDTRTDSEKPDYEFKDFTSNWKMGNIDTSGTGGGKIFIRGGKFFIDAGTIYADTYGDNNGAGIDVRATESLNISGHAYISSETLGKGNGGTISIDTSGLNISGFASISTQTYSGSEGNAGDMTIKATDSVNISSGYISSVSNGNGNAGSISIDTAKLKLDGAYIMTDANGSKGNAGSIIIKATEYANVASSYIKNETSGKGNSGNISIDTTKLNLSDNAYISSNSSGEGNAGNITIKATEQINIFGNAGGGSYIKSEVSGKGNSGSINIDTGKLNLSDSASISTDTQSGSKGNGGNVTIKAADSVNISSGYISSVSNGNGNAGSLSIDTAKLKIDGAAYLMTDANGSEGNAGSITIKATEYAKVASSYIKNETSGKGNSGSISIDTGKLSLSDNAYISTSALSGSEGNGGNIAIKAADFVNILSGYISSASYGNGNAGSITIKATEYINVSSSDIVSEASGKGNSGSVSIDTAKLSLSDGASIRSSIDLLYFIFSGGLGVSGGNGGNITIKATDSVNISLGNIGSESRGKGNSGSITIDTGKLNLSDGAYISSSSNNEGNGGNITIKATEQINIFGNAAGGSYILSNANGNGSAGRISINTVKLNLSDNAYIKTDTNMTGSEGNAGNITIKADDYINLSSASITSETSGNGNSGSLRIDTTKLNLSDNAYISTSALSGSEGNGGNITIKATDSVNILGYGNGDAGYANYIKSVTEGKGNAGNIRIDTASLNLLNAAYISSSTYDKDKGAGKGGSIYLKTVILSLNNGGKISAESTGSGNAGAIDITLDTMKLVDSSITTAADSAGGGQISITAGHMINLINSETTATVAGGTSSGGNINLTAPFFILNKSNVVAKADEGKGGNISLKTDTYIRSLDSEVSASSRLGIDGTVYESTPALDLTGKVALVQVAYTDTAALAPKQCVEREEELSSFTVKGRDGLPPFPDSLLAIP